jgi:hypothetical protein
VRLLCGCAAWLATHRAAQLSVGSALPEEEAMKARRSAATAVDIPSAVDAICATSDRATSALPAGCSNGSSALPVSEDPPLAAGPTALCCKAAQAAGDADCEQIGRFFARHCSQRRRSNSLTSRRRAAACARPRTLRRAWPSSRSARSG